MPSRVQPRPIAARPPEKSHLGRLLILSVALHIVLALLVAHVLSRHLAAPPEAPLDAEIDVALGEAVQELVVASPAHAPEPPPVTPQPEPPPAAEKPEFPEPPPLPKPITPPAPPKVQPAKPTPKGATAPPKARVGSVPRDGVVGGNVSEGPTTGTPGGKKLGDQGWRTPKPPYPIQARMANITGSGIAHITTDAAGNIVSCTVTGLPGILESNTRSFVRANWKGPPNATRAVPVIYRLQ